MRNLDIATLRSLQAVAEYGAVTRAAEALAAQNRFALALDKVSQMQTQLLAAEERRRELEAGLDSVQSTLRSAIDERDSARAVAQQAQAPTEPRDTGATRRSWRPSRQSSRCGRCPSGRSSEAPSSPCAPIPRRCSSPRW